MNSPVPFEKPVLVAQPILPRLSDYNRLLEGIWERRWLTNRGEMVVGLENALKEFLGVRNISLLGNGTLALQIAIEALALKGDVITTPFTFAATPHSLTWAGVTPIFADIDEETLTLSPDAVERAITSRTTGILGVHVYGMPCAVNELSAIAKRRDLRVLYDGAHSFNTRIDGKPLALFGDATILSFHATKLFHSIEGGAIVSTDPAVTERSDLLKNFGIRDEVTVNEAGINAKMNEMEAAMGLLVLKEVENERSARSRIFDIYSGELNRIDGFEMFALPAGTSNSFQYAILRIRSGVAPVDRDQLYDALKSYNVFSRKYFYPLCSEGPHYRDNPSAARNNLPIAYRVSREVLALPFHSGVDEAAAHRITNIISYVAKR